jgi:hypothetical protein
MSNTIALSTYIVDISFPRTRIISISIAIYFRLSFGVPTSENMSPNHMRWCLLAIFNCPRHARRVCKLDKSKAWPQKDAEHSSIFAKIVTQIVRRYRIAYSTYKELFWHYFLDRYRFAGSPSSLATSAHRFDLKSTKKNRFFFSTEKN